MPISFANCFGIGLVTLSGSLDASSAEAVRGQFRTWWQAQEGLTHLVVDLGDLQLIDSTGLGALLGFAKRVTERGGEMKLARPRPHVRLVMDITRATRVFEIMPTVDQALGAVGKARARPKVEAVV